MRFDKNDSKITFFLKSYCLFSFPANIPSLRSKYASSKEYYYFAFSFFTHLLVNICHGMDEWTLAAVNALKLSNLSADWLSIIYLEKTGTPLQKNTSHVRLG